MKVKTITIGYQTFALPEGTSAKDLQQLGGFLLSLREVGSFYSRGPDVDSFRYLGESARIQLGEDVLFTDRGTAEAARDARSEELAEEHGE